MGSSETDKRGELGKESEREDMVKRGIKSCLSQSQASMCRSSACSFTSLGNTPSNDRQMRNKETGEGGVIGRGVCG